MTSIKASNILIFGATGFIGSFITEKILAAQPRFNLVAIFTSMNTVNNKGTLLERWEKAGNVKVITGDVECESDVRRAYNDHGIDTVVCAFGRAAIMKQIDLLRWADETDSVKWFFPSEFGTDIEYGPQSQKEKPHQQKLKVRAFIREHVRKLQVTYVVTGPYFESWVDRQAGLDVSPGYDVQKREAYVVDDGEGKIGFTTMPDVGKLVLAALQRPEAALGKALKVNSFEVTPNQVLAEYEKQTGGAKWKVNRIPLSRLIEEETMLWDASNPMATGITLRRIWSEGGTLYESTDNGAIGLGPEDMESLEAAVQRMLQHF